MSDHRDTSNHKYNHDKQLTEWYGMAQSKLKNKISDNLKKRITTSVQAINYAIKHLLQDTNSNRIWISIHPNTPIYKYENIFPLFTISQKLIDNALKELHNKVDNWAGVDVSVMNEPPKHFKKYWTTADNWWNRYKAEWIGDHFFYPLLQNELLAYIGIVTNNITANDKQYTQELIYFMALRKILHTEVSFNRARKQPLIFDQSFTKSDCLQQFFVQLGFQHSIDWSIPPNNKKNKNRYHVRNYVREWTDEVLAIKTHIYDTVVMRKNINYSHNNINDKDIPEISQQQNNYNNNVAPLPPNTTTSIPNSSSPQLNSYQHNIPLYYPPTYQPHNNNNISHFNDDPVSINTKNNSKYYTDNNMQYNPLNNQNAFCNSIENTNRNYNHSRALQKSSDHDIQTSFDDNSLYHSLPTSIHCKPYIHGNIFTTGDTKQYSSPHINTNHHINSPHYQSTDYTYTQNISVPPPINVSNSVMNTNNANYMKHNHLSQICDDVSLTSFTPNSNHSRNLLSLPITPQNNYNNNNNNNNNFGSLPPITRSNSYQQHISHYYPPTHQPHFNDAVIINTNQSGNTNDNSKDFTIDVSLNSFTSNSNVLDTDDFTIDQFPKYNL
eukprot:268238_1